MQIGLARLAGLLQGGQQPIRAAVAEATAGLFDDLPADDVATLTCVPTTITDRANAPARLAS